MRKVSIFKNGNNRAVRLPKGMDFPGANELEIIQDGNSVILRPVRPDWSSFAVCDKADADFLDDRQEVAGDEGRFSL